jgi:hypothetical protein
MNAKSDQSFTIVYIESPLQFLSALPNINNAEHTIIIIRNRGLEAYARPILNTYIEAEIEVHTFDDLSGFVKILFFKTNQKLKRILIGDPRSFYSQILMLLHWRSQNYLLDDGSYTLINDDGGGCYEVNSTYWILKSFIFKFIVKPERLSRATLFKHKITNPYRTLIRHDFKALLDKISPKVHQAKGQQVELSLFYIESKLDDWVGPDTERAIYLALVNLCKEIGRRLVIIAHRNSTEDEIKSKLPLNAIAEVIVLGNPVEIWCLGNARKGAIYSCALTTTAHSLVALNLCPQTYLIKINLSRFLPKFKRFAERFYKCIESGKPNFKDVIEIK